MYNNVYQEYINSIFGMNLNYNRMETTNFENTINNNQFFQPSVNNENLEKLYPELYKVLYPMIKHACMKNTNQLSENTINNIVEEVYSNFVSDDTGKEDFDSNNEFRSGKNIEKSVVTKSKNSTVTNPKKEETRENKQDNYILRDLIRILIVRELLGKPGENTPRFQHSPFMPPFGHRYNSIYETSPIIY